MNVRTLGVVIVGAVAVGTLAAPAGEPKQPTTAPVDMSASDVGASLTRMLLDKPKVPVTLPIDVARPAEPVETPVEGSMIVDRLCRLTREEKAGWALLTFEPEPARRSEMPRRALPCWLLERMEPLAASSPSVRFRVSGETTVYRQRGYLLLTKATVLTAAPPAARPKPAPPPTPGPLVSEAAASQPASRPAGSGREPTSDDILKRLLQENVGRPVRPPTVAGEPTTAPSVAPGAGKVLAAGRGSMVVDRLVRVLPELTSQWWQARFEADNTLQEPPMRLLPCGFLERAHRMQAARPPAAMRLLRVSGLVTHYKGRRYLLLRKLMPERRLGRF